MNLRIDISVGSGVNFADYGDITEALVYTEGRRYSIPGLSFEDVAQEVRLECLKAMKSFDSERIGNSPYRYLQTCVKNRLYNMRRGIYVPNNPPCARCKLWDKELKMCKVQEVGCREIINYRRGMSQKASLKNPTEINYERVNDDSLSQMEVEAKILDEDIRSVLPKDLIADYKKMVNGSGDRISSKNKQRIREVVQKLLSEDA